ncbi:reprolysin-like metallopeptidase [Spirosoma agri]|uniref:Calx-beta domain-containing protein n=1 Tax=Spirosoma agri TaxID=1987381 RepID=A0A6M0IDH5_9BACT|nr:zinc-dependent metalloprotease family protein [Spirosoma agri]NEU66228.1 hypothetical protein [Spirosoma agri]
MSSDSIRVGFTSQKNGLSLWLVLGCLLVNTVTAVAQDGFFVPIASSQLRASATDIVPIDKFAAYQLKTDALRAHLSKAPQEFQPATTTLRLDIPLPNGTTEPFAMTESSVLSPQLAAQYRDIKTYAGKGLNHPTYTIRLSLTSSGFDAIVLGVETSAVYITKVSREVSNQQYVTYFARDVKKNDPAKPFGSFGKCSTVTPLIEALPEKSGAKARSGAALNNTGTVLRTFRLALSVTKEFTQTKGGGTVDGSFNAVVGYVNRLNAVYRTELSVAFTLVSGKGTVYSPGNDGGLNNGDLGSMLDKNQVILDNAIGNAGYDIGHVIGNSSGSGEGLAEGSSACVPTSKAKGASSFGDGSFAPVFDDQTFNHEVGHQFSMSHTFNSSIPVCTTREAKTSVEPGAGTTIMSYGFTCSDDKNTARNDNYEAPYQPFLNFHTVSYQQAVNYINTLSCFTSTPLNNALPMITNFPANVTIPKSTPFMLSATASDANAGDQLTYSWEGTDIGTVVPDASTLANTALPPFFRSYAPSSTGTRLYPRLDAILNGSNKAKGDKLPSVGITTNHTLTVRDNVGGVTFQSMTVTVDGNSGPFLETTNLAGTYPASSLQTITWSVANTTAPPVNCASVNILLSTDGGQTFPTTLVANTPNDGSEAIRFPDIRTSQGRIKIVSSNSIFFDISNANFTISDPIMLTGAPIVKVNSTDPNSSEGNSTGGSRRGAARAGSAADPGFIRFERTDTKGTLVVNYQIGGTATNGVDFASLPTSVTFADGQAVYTEEVDPIEDDIIEGDETIIITLVDDDAYDPDPDALTTTLNIKDNDTGTFTIAAVTPVSCQTLSAGLRQVSFSPQYAGTNGQPVSFSVVNELVPTTASGPYTLNLYTDNPVIILKATQAGTATEASFTYNWLAACSPATPASFAITGATMVSCQTVSPGLRQVRFTPQYTGTNGQPVSFSVVNELVPTTASGPYTLNLYTDNPAIVLKATQTGTAAEASFIYNWLAACGTGTLSKVSAEQPTTLSIRLFGNPAQNGQVRFEVRGATGQPLQLSLTDMRGQAVGSHHVEQARSLEQHTFEVGRLPMGALVLRVATPTESKAVTVLKVD